MRLDTRWGVRGDGYPEGSSPGRGMTCHRLAQIMESSGDRSPGREKGFF